MFFNFLELERMLLFVPIAYCLMIDVGAPQAYIFRNSTINKRSNDIETTALVGVAFYIMLL